MVNDSYAGSAGVLACFRSSPWSLSKRLALIFVVLFVVAVFYSLLFPVPITPLQPGHHQALQLCRVFMWKQLPGLYPTTASGDGRNPEDVALDAEGHSSWAS